MVSGQDDSVGPLMPGVHRCTHEGVNEVLERRQGPDRHLVFDDRDNDQRRTDLSGPEPVAFCGERFHHAVLGHLAPGRKPDEDPRGVVQRTAQAFSPDFDHEQDRPNLSRVLG